MPKIRVPDQSGVLRPLCPMFLHSSLISHPDSVIRHCMDSLPQSSEGETTIVPPDDAKAQEWITALAAAGFDYRLSHDADGWLIHVAPDVADAVQAEIDGYEADNRNWPPLPRAQLRPPQAQYDSSSALWVAGMLVAFYVWLGPYSDRSPLLRSAAADTDRILAGEWWRPITALTVHAEFSHLLANVICIYFLGQAICRIMGGGLAWVLILGAGVAGNAGVAWVLQSDHVSIGASTSGFGALGVLTAYQVIQRLRYGEDAPAMWGRTWLPLGAGLALLAVLGTGPNTDLAAHALGFSIGLLASIPLSWYGTRWLPDWMQPVLQIACLGAVMGAWRIVLKAAG